MEEQRAFHCTECGQFTAICRSCDRGQKYCTPQCSKQGRLKAVRAASRRYQKTRQGKHQHAARQARYRQKEELRKIVTHTSSQDAARYDLLKTMEKPPAVLSMESPKEASISTNSCCRCGRDLSTE